MYYKITLYIKMNAYLNYIWMYDIIHSFLVVVALSYYVPAPSTATDADTVTTVLCVLSI